jgi:hypothetical protein
VLLVLWVVDVGDGVTGFPVGERVIDGEVDNKRSGVCGHDNILSL